jgi:hypothetical protein
MILAAVPAPSRCETWGVAKLAHRFEEARDRRTRVRLQSTIVSFGDAGQACRTAAAVRSTPTHHAGKRAQRFNASTSDHAFWLWRISCGVWCRVTDVASRKPLVDAGIVRIRASAVSRRAEPAADGRQDWPAQVAGIFERSSTGNTLCTRPLRPSATSKAATRGESRHHV